MKFRSSIFGKFEPNGIKKLPAPERLGGLSNGFHVVRLTSLDQALDPSQLEYQLTSSGDGTKISGLLSDSDVYGVIGSNVSFHDRDAGYSVTKGDYFVIDSNSVGSDNGEWKLKLIDLSSSTLLFDTQLIEIQY